MTSIRQFFILYFTFFNDVISG